MKLRTQYWQLVMPLALLTASSCDPICLEGKGPLITHTAEIKQFNGVRLKISAEVILEQGNEQVVKVEAQDNVFKVLKFKVVNDVLEIDNSECIGTNAGINIRITMPEVKKMIVLGSGSIETEGRIASEHLELAINGSGTIRGDVDARSVYAGIKGSGEIILKGQTSQQTIKVMGSGSFKANDFAAVQTEAEVNGSGEIYVYTIEKLKAVVNGSGLIRYRGSPELKTEVNGSGEVSKID